jgi:hypothetical protein
MFLKLLGSPKSKLCDRAIVECASKRSLVAVYVQIAALRVRETFVEVEANDLWTLISFLAIEA